MQQGYPGRPPLKPSSKVKAKAPLSRQGGLGRSGNVLATATGSNARMNLTQENRCAHPPASASRPGLSKPVPSKAARLRPPTPPPPPTPLPPPAPGKALIASKSGFPKPPPGPSPAKPGALAPPWKLPNTPQQEKNGVSARLSPYFVQPNSKAKRSSTRQKATECAYRERASNGYGKASDTDVYSTNDRHDNNEEKGRGAWHEGYEEPGRSDREHDRDKSWGSDRQEGRAYASVSHEDRRRNFQEGWGAGSAQSYSRSVDAAYDSTSNGKYMETEQNNLKARFNALLERLPTRMPMSKAKAVAKARDPLARTTQSISSSPERTTPAEPPRGFVTAKNAARNSKNIQSPKDPYSEAAPGPDALSGVKMEKAYGRGYELLKKMGYKDGSALGKKGDGLAVPLMPEGNVTMLATKDEQKQKTRHGVSFPGVAQNINTALPGVVSSNGKNALPASTFGVPGMSMAPFGGMMASGMMPGMAPGMMSMYPMAAMNMMAYMHRVKKKKKKKKKKTSSSSDSSSESEQPKTKKRKLSEEDEEGDKDGHHGKEQVTAQADMDRTCPGGRVPCKKSEVIDLSDVAVPEDWDEAFARLQEDLKAADAMEDEGGEEQEVLGAAESLDDQLLDEQAEEWMDQRRGAQEEDEVDEGYEDTFEEVQEDPYGFAAAEIEDDVVLSAAQCKNSMQNGI